MCETGSRTPNLHPIHPEELHTYLSSVLGLILCLSEKGFHVPETSEKHCLHGTVLED